MKIPRLFWCIVACVWAPLQLKAAADTVAIRETTVPVLIERQDNELIDLRIEAVRSHTLNSVALRFGDDVDLSEIESVKLYYGGTESAERQGETYFAARDYLSKDTPGQTTVANPSYSVLKSEVKEPGREMVLPTDQSLFPGINYFWVSLQMKAEASIHSKVSVEVSSVSLDGEEAPLKVVHKVESHYLGVGVRHAGDDGVAAFRIPGLVTSNKGTLLGVYDVRHNSSADLQEHIDIGLSRSTDGGQTWERMRIPMAFGESGGLPKAQNGVGDPAILVDRQTGSLWIVAVWTHGMGKARAWTSSQPGLDAEHTGQLVMVRSDDDGMTWSDPINVTEQVKDPTWHFLLQGPGRGISMDDGTLVFACQYIDADRIPNASIIYSQDHGQTWHIGNCAYANTTEAQVVELEPGVLMLNMRNNDGSGRIVSVTSDLGQTWTEHASSRSALQEPVCMASLIRVKAEENALGQDLLLFSNPNTRRGRRNITIKASLDGGNTWLEENQLLLDAGYDWGYSCLTLVDPETVGILYESSVAHITFQAIRLNDIIQTSRRK